MQDKRNETAVMSVHVVCFRVLLFVFILERFEKRDLFGNKKILNTRACWSGGRNPFTVLVSSWEGFWWTFGTVLGKIVCIVLDAENIFALWQNVSTVCDMELLCDNSHLHEPWGCNAQGWATAQETAYPWSLSRKIAQLIAVHLQQQGVQCPTPSSAKHAAHLDSSIRQQTHVQSSATRLPWVS